MSVDTDDAFVLPSRLEVPEEVGPIWRVHHLGIAEGSRWRIKLNSDTAYHNLRYVLKHFFTLVMRPSQISCMTINQS